MMAQKPEQDGDQKTAVNNTAAPAKQDEAKADSTQTSNTKVNKEADKTNADSAQTSNEKDSKEAEKAKADSAQTSEAKDSKKAEKVQLYEVLFPVKINGKRNEIGDKIKLDLSDEALNELVLAKVIKKA